MSSSEYFAAIRQLRKWKDEGLAVDWSWPANSEGEHLAFLLGASSIHELMAYGIAYDEQLRKLCSKGQPHGYFYYKMLVSQRIPELPLR